MILAVCMASCSSIVVINRPARFHNVRFKCALDVILLQMVRTYQRKTDRGNYGTETLGKALEAVHNGTPIKTASRQFGIPAKTLRRHRDGNVTKPGHVKLGSIATVFTKEQEQILVGHIKSMEKSLYGLSTTDIRRLAFDLAKQMGVHHKHFAQGSSIAGYDWLSGFMRRHPELSVRMPEATSLSRAVGFNWPQVQKFYAALKEALDCMHASALRIWNMDETGISSVHKPVKIIASKGARSVGKVTSGERGKTVTVICAASAAGAFVPPAFIYPRKKMVPSLMNGAPAGSLGLCSSSGWTDSNLFLVWLKHFAQFTKCSKEEPHILLLDGHHSHKTLDAVMYAREKGITMITFPPHCTHKLQPLDLSFFKALKSSYNVAAGNWMSSNPGRRISFFEMAGIFSAAYSKSASIGKAVSGFDAAGIWPYNPNKYGPEDFGGSAVTDEPEPGPSNTENDQSGPVISSPVLPSLDKSQQSPSSIQPIFLDKVILTFYFI